MSENINKMLRAGGASDLQDFDKLRISIASPEQILSWSHGEVKKPETINYRTFKPEKDGLFCAKIFGPTKDYECLCGRYKRVKHRGIICERCGVEVNLSKVRRERMGHIKLAAPVAHVWFSKAVPSRMGTLLDMTSKDLDRILYFDSFIVLNPGLTILERGQVLSDQDVRKAKKEYGEDSFEVGTGAEAIRTLLKDMDLAKERETLREELFSSSADFKRKKIVKKLKLVEAFLNSGVHPAWMVMDVIAVLPADLRPLVPLDGGRFASADLNDFYRRLINRNNRLRRLMDLNAPEIILRNEKRMLQEIVDALFDNGRRSRPITSNKKRPLKSLSEALKGKHGRFRMNLLGKRVDYSGRSVIVVGPKLKLHQCGIPKRMALELFKPFVYAKLEKYGFAQTIKAAKRVVEREQKEVWDILEEVIKERPVLLNRAPTLHRLGIQAFEPVLVEGKAIHLHPLVCSAFNADFDGDQMAVHVPLSLAAQVEARVLMLSTRNILNPANGNPIILPSKDIVLGIYYLSLMRDFDKDDHIKLYGDMSEVLINLDQKNLHLHDPIYFRMKDTQGQNQRFLTTPGRLIIWQEIADCCKNLDFKFANTVLTATQISELITGILRQEGQDVVVTISDRFMQLGFKYACLSGISFGYADLVVPAQKPALIKQAMATVEKYHNQYMEGLITDRERYNKVMDAWGKCTEEVAEHMMTGMSQEDSNRDLNSIYIMAHSKARGSPAQMRQLAAMRGLIVQHDGSIIERPIISSLKEGVTTAEFFSSTHGSRKGLSDTALKTANSGYLTRRLVEASQDCIVTEQDCKTSRGITIQSFPGNHGVGDSLEKRIFGRTLVDPIVDPASGEILVESGKLVDERDVAKVRGTLVHTVTVRSVLTCEVGDGRVCATCYGRDLARGSLVNIGEPVGVVAAHSIGEPGTQLTMRTFHSGGAAQRASEDIFVEAAVAGKISFKNPRFVKDTHGQWIVVGRDVEAVILNDRGVQLSVQYIAYGATLRVEEGDQVEKGQQIAEQDPYTIPIVSESEGFVDYQDLVHGVALQETQDEGTGVTTRRVLDWKNNQQGSGLRPQILLRNGQGEIVRSAGGSEARYILSPGSVLLFGQGAHVNVGDIIVKIPKDVQKSKDITGGLPRIAELFEARYAKDAATISECDGRIEYGKDYKVRRCLLVHPSQGGDPIEHWVPHGKQILVQDGENVKKGQLLVEGSVAPHDILQIMGVEALATHLVQEIQEVYQLQGVQINDKHIEVIILQMLRRVEVVDPGDTLLLTGDHVDHSQLIEENKQVLKEGKKPATTIPVLQGITKASLQTQSFMSAASFQETTRVLAEAAIYGKIDPLLGIKENVIAGRLIPCGTGLVAREVKREARARDLAVGSLGEGL